MRRWTIALAVLIAVALFVFWRADAPPPPIEQPAPAPVRSPSPSPSPARRAVPPPAIHLAKPVVVRPSPPAAPGALEGVVVDRRSGDGIAGAELTFSHDDGAYSTASVAGGAFRFAPRATGVYRLVSIEAKGYRPFEREFGSSPVSFTSVAGKDVGGVVLRLARERNDGARHPDLEASLDDAGPSDAGDAGPARATGSLRGRVFDARSQAPVAAFAIALWRREGLGHSDMVAPASFIDPSGSYEIDGLPPGAYEVGAMAAGYAWSSYAVAQIAGTPVEVDFALHSGARVTGMVSDDSTKRPIAGAWLSLEGRRADAPNLPGAPLPPGVDTDGDGRFALEHVPPDALSLQAGKRGYLTRIVSLGALPEDGDAPALAIALTPQAAGSDAHFELTGIGATLQARGDAVVIEQVFPGAGASDAGLGPGDAIVAIDGTAVTELGFERAIGAIRGPEGSTVVLRIRRGGAESDVTVTRKLVRH